MQAGQDTGFGHPDLDPGRAEFVEDELAEVFSQRFNQLEAMFRQGLPGALNDGAVVDGVFARVGLAGAAMWHGELDIENDGLRR